MKIMVYNKVTNRMAGEITRKATHERAFGNSGAFEVSVGGKRYWGVGNSLYLPQVAIDYLKKKSEL